MTAGKPTPVPRLRFPEFQDAPDWKTGRCRDIAEVLPGYGFPNKFQGNKKGQYPFYKVSDISHTIEKGQRYISEANNYINADVLDKIRGKSVPAGTIIFAKIGEAIRSNRRVITAKPAVIDNNTAGVKAMKVKSSDEFLFYLWSNISLINHAGGVVPAVSKSALENVPLCYPNDPAEQQKIADCLGSLDDLTAAEGRKLEALRQHKQGLMQQLFPQSGESVPRLRFPEFLDDPTWSAPQIANLYGFKRTNTLSRDKLNYETGTIRNIHYGDIHTKFKPLFRVGDEYVPYVNPDASANGFDDDAFCEEGDIVLADASEDLDDVGKAIEVVSLGGERVVAGTHTILATRRENVPVVGFGGQLFQSAAVRTRIKNEAQGSKVYGISAKRISAVPVPIPPTVAEQQKIADLLTSFDDLIAAQSQKLDALKSHKKGLMQQLFPSLEEESR